MEISVNGFSSERDIRIPKPPLWVLDNDFAVNQDHTTELALCGNSIKRQLRNESLINAQSTFCP